MKYISKRKPKSDMPSKRRNAGAKRQVSNIDPSLLIRKAERREIMEFQSSWTYEEIDLHPELKRNLADRNYVHPTPIQEQSLQHSIKGKDILGIANTGTGKTAAFLIPIVEQLLQRSEQFQTLVVVPTRELALQVEEEFRAITKGLDLHAACFIGGTRIESDLAKLKRPIHVIVGTPGRLLDLASQRALNLGRISTLVIDEFDRMLDMGFVQDVRKILNGLTNRKQTMFFSATIDNNHRKMIDSILNHPVEIRVSQGTTASEQVDQELVHVPAGDNKFDVLLNLVGDSEFRKVLIFAETKRIVNQVGKKLNQSGIRSDVIHGNKSQNYRVKALRQFSEGKVRILVATDIAARGLDVSDVSHVINYQLPRSMDSYIHRIGRTGRAGKYGRAFTFVD